MTAPSVDLQGFVQTSLSKGLPKKDLRSILLDSGWDKATVDSYIKKHHPELKELKGSLITIRSISKRYGKDKILDNLNLQIKEGEIFGIIGLSGTGKTTLLNLLVGFVEPDTGDILLHIKNKDYSVFKHPHLVKRRVGFSTQDPSFYKDLSVLENLEHFASLYDMPRKNITRNAIALLKLVDLYQHRDERAHNLSGGMQKKLDIACALMHEPKILILDEPTADLDTLTRRSMWELVDKINKKGTTVIVASHFLGDIEHICDRIGILRNQKIAEIGSPEDLRVIYSRNHEIHLQTTSADYSYYSKALLSQKDLRVTKTKREDQGLVIFTIFPEPTLHYILHLLENKKDTLVRVDVTRPTIQEVFENLVQ